jgi:hypothetical protein
VARARASIEVGGRPAEAEALWYDTARWPAFVDGLARVVGVEGDWPGPGAEVRWASRPGGRGEVRERVVGHAPRDGQEVQVEDEMLRGTQHVRFEPGEDGGTVVSLELEFELKAGSLLGPLRTFFVKRSMGDSLGRTLRRFAVEREAEPPV